MKRILAALLAAAMMLSLSVVGFAAGTPEYNETLNIFFANGTPITISEPSTPEMGATITWAGGSEEVPSNVTVMGGSHNDNTQMTTSITMNGGTVRNLMGGGLHKSHVTSATVVMNGGTATSVQGGGASSFTHACDCENGSSWYADDPAGSPCQTDSASVTINGGTITYSLFGGGEGISNTNNATVIVKNGDLSNAYVIGGGSNGRTGNAEIIIRGGDIGTALSVNRGEMNSSSVEMTGGSVDTLYLGGIGDSGTIGKVEASLTGGSIKELNAGTTGDKDLANPENSEDAKNIIGTVSIAEGVVEDPSGLGDNITVVEVPAYVPGTDSGDNIAITDNDANTSEAKDAIRAGETVEVELRNSAPAIALDTMNLLGANEDASLVASIGDMTVTIPGGFGRVTEAGRVYYPLGFRSPSRQESDMEDFVPAGAEFETVEAGGSMTMPAAVTVTLETDLEGTVHVYLYDEDADRVTYIASPVEEDGKVTFTTTRLGHFLLTSEKI